MDLNLRKLYTAVIACHADFAIELMETHNFPESVITDVVATCGLSDTEPFNRIAKMPLYRICQCCEIIFGEGGDTFPSSAKQKAAETHRLLDYFRTKGYDVDTPINFMDYRDICARTKDYELRTHKFLFNGTKEQLIEKGYNPDEVALCFAIETYDKPVIYKLLENRVNPSIYIDAKVDPQMCNESHNNSAIDCIDLSIFDMEVIYGLGVFWESNPGEVVGCSNWDTLRGLFSGAAYQQILFRMIELGLA